MSKSTLKWGVSGAIGFLSIELLLIAIQELLPYDSPFRKVLQSIGASTGAPVIWMWEAFGVRGETGLRLFVPVLVSIFIFWTGIGFIAGVLINKLRQMK